MKYVMRHRRMVKKFFIIMCLFVWVQKPVFAGVAGPVHSPSNSPFVLKQATQETHATLYHIRVPVTSSDLHPDVQGVRVLCYADGAMIQPSNLFQADLGASGTSTVNFYVNVHFSSNNAAITNAGYLGSPDEMIPPSVVSELTQQTLPASLQLQNTDCSIVPIAQNCNVLTTSGEISGGYNAAGEYIGVGGNYSCSWDDPDREEFNIKPQPESNLSGQANFQ